MLKLRDIILASSGILVNVSNEEDIIKDFVIDSREVSKGDFFVPIVGEKVNGNDYIIDSVNKGIVGFFIEFDAKNKEDIINKAIEINNSICIIEVENSIKALQDTAKYYRLTKINIPIVAITGSVGKTSTREMIASILKQENDVFTTQKNYNGNIGLPIMMLKMENQDVGIFEAGIDTIGEMNILSDILKPDVCVITKIGTSHIEYLGSRENIFKEKLCITNNIKGLKRLFVNGNDDFLCQLENNDKYKVFKYCIEDAKDIKVLENSIVFNTNIYNEEKSVVINDIGYHNILNALVAINIGELFNISTDNIIKGISSYKNYMRRLERFNLNNGVILIDDTYNASLDSMKTGLLTVNHMGAKRKIAVLGDMLELGKHTKKLHMEVGEIFNNLKFDFLFTYGENAKIISDTALKYFDNGRVINFKNKEGLKGFLINFMEKEDVIYFKASNGMKFNELIQTLINKFNIEA